MLDLGATSQSQHLILELRMRRKDVVRSRNEDEGEMIWMEKSTSYIFQDDDSETLHVKIDWWHPSSGKYKGIFLEKYWVPNHDDT